MDQFLTIIGKVTNKIMKLIKETNIPYNETEEVIEMRNNATECYLFEKPFDENNIAVIDHNHFTGEVRGIAHQACNLHYHLQNSKIPLIFHNLKGYDSHLIIKQIGKYMIKNNNQKGKIDCIANNSQKFLSFSWNNARFIDSIQFMNSSLATLGSNLKNNQKTYTMDYLKEKFGNKLSEEERQEVLNKGLFPYSWMDKKNKLKYEGLPEPEAFYNDLTDTPVNMREYNQSKELFKKLGLKTFEEWLLLYQTIDVKLLTDIWINFRDMSLKHNKLEPGHYFTSPGLAWYAILKLIKINLELISNPDMYMMFERQSRGGVSMTGNKRYSKANNTICKDYNEEEEYIQNIYLDANNLYGHAMIQKLPFKNFKFIKEEKLLNYDAEFILNYQNEDKGYVYEVDIQYPEELHDRHNAYPLAPQQLTIQYEQLSKYNKDAIKKLRIENDIKINIGKTKKLIPNLYNKERYVCNISNLKLYLQLGLRITKIHRIISFDQKDYMRQYIELNTSLRQKASNEFEKDFFKLMNNSVFGKTMENVRKRANYELVFSDKRMKKIVNSRFFKNYIKISENLALVEKYQKTVKLDKPAYVGMQILDHSKVLMHDFYYNHFIDQFKKVDLIMTDTDSLFMRVTCSKDRDVYDSMIENADRYDFSNLTKVLLFEKIKKNCEEKQLDLKTFLNQNKAVLCKMKNESPNAEIIEAISINSKCYDFTTSDGQCKKKLKGIKSCVVKKDITYENYKECILQQKIKNVEQKSFRSYNQGNYKIGKQGYQ